jgi:hypothetical protein
VDEGKGYPYWQELLSFGAFGNSSCWYTAYSSLGRMLISANILTFGLIGKTDHIELKKIICEYEYGI